MQTCFFFSVSLKVVRSSNEVAVGSSTVCESLPEVIGKQYGFIPEPFQAGSFMIASLHPRQSSKFISASITNKPRSTVVSMTHGLFGAFFVSSAAASSK